MSATAYRVIPVPLDGFNPRDETKGPHLLPVAVPDRSLILSAHVYDGAGSLWIAWAGGAGHRSLLVVPQGSSFVTDLNAWRFLATLHFPHGHGSDIWHLWQPAVVPGTEERFI